MKQKTNNEKINKTKISLFNKTYKALIRLMTKKKKRERVNSHKLSRMKGT